MGIKSKSPMMLVLIAGMGLFACEQAGPLDPSPSEGAITEDLSVLLSAATVDGPVATPASEEGREEGARGTTDHRRRQTNVFDILAAKIPGFGGLYRVQPCTVALVLVGDSDPDGAAAIVEDVVEPLVRRGCPDGIEVRVVEGTFTYLELLRIRHAIRPLHEIRGVVGARIDFQQNKVIVSVASREIVDEVRAALARLGVPVEGVGVEVASGRRGA